MKTQTAFGHFSAAVNNQIFGIVLAVLRVVLGLQFLIAGIEKISSDWSAENYLLAATGPLAQFFISLAGNPIVDYLVIIGELIIGTALILGLLVRPASFFASIMIILFFISNWVDNTAFGYVEWHTVYVLIFIIFMAGGAGHVYGLDGILRRNFGRKRGWLADLLFG